jgi:segregation and condensation protein B
LADLDPAGVDADRFAEADPRDGPDEPDEPSPAQVAGDLAAALEAVCFVLNRPLSVAEAAAILECSTADVAEATQTLAASLRGRGLMLQRHQEELQLVTRPQTAWAVQRALNPERPARLSRAALETLAIVAYRQPLTRAAIEAIRGVGCEAVLESLERRDLIVEVGRQETPGHPRLFGTTLRFLQVVGLEHIEDLPPLPEGTRIPPLLEEPWGLDAAAEDAVPGDAAADGSPGEAAPEVPEVEAAADPAAGT